MKIILDQRKEILTAPESRLLVMAPEIADHLPLMRSIRRILGFKADTSIVGATTYPLLIYNGLFKEDKRRIIGVDMEKGIWMYDGGSGTIHVPIGSARNYNYPDFQESERALGYVPFGVYDSENRYHLRIMERDIRNIMRKIH